MFWALLCFKQPPPLSELAKMKHLPVCCNVHHENVQWEINWVYFSMYIMNKSLTEGAQQFYVQAAAAEPSQVEEPGVNITLTDAFRGGYSLGGGGSLSCLLFLWL